LEGKVAVITGGAAGIGLATTRLYLNHGAQVVVGDLQKCLDPSLQSEFGDRIEFMKTDVSVEDEVRTLVDRAVERFGRLDVMFNNAGYGGTLASITDFEAASVERSIGVLLMGVLFGYKYAGRVMKQLKSGSIITTSSDAGLVGGAAPFVYSVCKAAVIHLAKCAAIELAPDNIRSNAICPGMISTQLLVRAWVTKAEASGFMAFLEERAKQGMAIPRVGSTEDIANMALFLAGDASRFVTGQAISVDGGFAANPAADGGQTAAIQNAVAAFRAQA
jgi:NAD(P)-dependent dehydrogenase (short-subunit alcohol dehydrogenase family)